MSYKIDLEALSGIYALPAAVVDKHIKLSGAIQLKVLLLGIRNPAKIDEQKIAEALSIPLPDVIDALNYWTDLGVLCNAEQTETNATVKTNEKVAKPVKKIVLADAVKPTREEVARRGNESSDVAFLLREAQVRLSRPLTPNEAATLVWLFDDEGIDAMVLLMLISFAKSEGRPNIGFIERTAVKWTNEGVLTVNDAEAKIRHIYEMRTAWKTVEKAMGIPHRMPSQKEEKLAYTWVCEYNYTSDILRRAYDACIDATSNFSIPYIKKVLETWHKAGVKNVQDIDKLEKKNAESKPKKTDGKETFNVNLFNQSLNDLPE